MTVTRQRLGRRGEDLVATRLAGDGWRILARNARVGSIRGELDIVALEGLTLVFVEVKARSAVSVAGPETPALAVGPAKRRKLRALAGAWLAEHRVLPRFGDIRFDVVGLRLDAAGRPVEWEHVRGAF